MSDEVTPEDFQAILAQLRDWVRTKVVPREREIADTDAIPDDLRKQAADMGLFGYAIPPEWGGLGLDLTQDVELAMELGYTSLKPGPLSRCYLAPTTGSPGRCW